MADKAIKKGDPAYEKLLSIWLKEGKKTWVVLPNGTQFRAVTPSDDVVVFVPHSADSLYGSISGTGGNQ